LFEPCTTQVRRKYDGNPTRTKHEKILRVEAEKVSKHRFNGIVNAYPVAENRDVICIVDFFA
ncbi:MAG TPA: hypothetical protein PK949_02595, partial [Dysgonamonadaceae bacterium]|nr:hypothetical protein [Dysgonamonadaceae bacterium]